MNDEDMTLYQYDFKCPAFEKRFSDFGKKANLKQSFDLFESFIGQISNGSSSRSSSGSSSSNGSGRIAYFDGKGIFYSPKRLTEVNMVAGGSSCSILNFSWGRLNSQMESNGKKDLESQLSSTSSTEWSKLLTMHFIEWRIIFEDANRTNWPTWWCPIRKL